jgi:hypothetical protein
MRLLQLTGNERGPHDGKGMRLLLRKGHGVGNEALVIGRN